MLLSRSTMIIILMVGVESIKLREVKVPGQGQSTSDVTGNGASRVGESSVGEILVKDDPKINANTSNEPSWLRHPRTTFVKAILANPKLSSTQLLAQKFANDVLKSAKMRETIRRLSSVDGLKKSTTSKSLVSGMWKKPNSQLTRRKLNRKRHKGVKKKKKKRKRRKHKHKRSLWESKAERSSGSASKGICDTRSNLNFDTSEENTEGYEISNRIDVGSLFDENRGLSESDHNRGIDYVEFAESSICKGARTKPKATVSNANSDPIFEGGSMIERLMRTTTRDPNKKNPGDQGIEYSDYYNDDDVLSEALDTKNPELEEDVGNNRVRAYRQISNYSSLDQNYSFGDYTLPESLDDPSQGTQDFSYDANDNSQIFPPVDNQIYSVEANENSNDIASSAEQNYLSNPDVLYSSQDTPVLENVSPADRSQRMYNYGGKNKWRQYSNYDYPSKVHPSTVYLNRYDPNNLKATSSDKFNKYLPSRELSGVNSYSNVDSSLDPMQLPFGEVLENMGINVNDGASKNDKEMRSRVIALANRLRDRPSGGLYYNLTGTDLQTMSTATDFGNEEIEKDINQSKLSTDMVDGSGSKYEIGKEFPRVSERTNESKEVTNEMLHQIMEDLQDLKMDRAKNSNREGAPCRLSGSWIAAQANVNVNMKVVNHSITVNLENVVASVNPGIINTTWNVTGSAPFRRGGPFTLFACHNRSKSLAVFVGTCRVCDGIDTIQGIWTVAHQPKDCKGLSMSTQALNDVFHRTRPLSTGKKKHAMHNVTTTTVFTPPSTTESSSTKKPS